MGHIWFWNFYNYCNIFDQMLQNNLRKYQIRIKDRSTIWNSSLIIKVSILTKNQIEINKSVFAFQWTSSLELQNQLAINRRWHWMIKFHWCVWKSSKLINNNKITQQKTTNNFLTNLKCLTKFINAINKDIEPYRAITKNNSNVLVHQIIISGKYVVEFFGKNYLLYFYFFKVFSHTN